MTAEAFKKAEKNKFVCSRPRGQRVFCVTGPAQVRRCALELARAAPHASTTAGVTTQQSKKNMKPCVLTAHVTTFTLAGEHRSWSVDDRIGHEREPPLRVQPAEVAARQSGTTDNAEQIENRVEYHIETPP